MRAPFFTASIVPVMLGTSVALYETGSLNWLHLFLVSVGVLGCHAGSNMINDYYDYVNLTDEINRFRSPFNGGSGCIQENLVSPVGILRAGVFCFCVSFTVGLYLCASEGGAVLLFVATGIISGYIYSGFPKLSSRGLGEFLVALNFGPLIVTGAHFIQAGTFSLLALIVSLPIGLLIAAVLYINQFPDYEADSLCRKRNLVVTLGLKAALPYYYLLMAGAYSTIIVGILFNILPHNAIFTLLTFPTALVAALTARRWYGNPKRILPANALTIFTHFSVGFVLTAVFFWESIPLSF